MKVRGRSKNDNFTFDCEEGERILYAGLRSGLALPYECATGTCGTCKARVRDPDTINDLWPEAPGNAYLKRERGEFLMCQACAVADCEIAVPANIDAVRTLRPERGWPFCPSRSVWPLRKILPRLKSCKTLPDSAATLCLNSPCHGSPLSRASPR